MKEEELKTAFDLIQGILYLLPMILGLWKLSSVVHQVKTNAKDVNDLGKRLNNVVETLKAENTELINKFNIMTNQITELLTSMSHIRKDIEELKSDMKGIVRKGASKK